MNKRALFQFYFNNWPKEAEDYKQSVCTGKTTFYFRVAKLPRLGGDFL